MFIINAFLSGLLFFVYMIINSWWWLLGVVVFILLTSLENKEVEDLYVDDERDIL